MNTQDRGLKAVFHRRFRHGLEADKLITVCDRCLQASCWHGEFMCDLAGAAGTVQKTVAELEALSYEHPDNWRRQALVHGEVTQAEFDAAQAAREAV